MAIVIDEYGVFPGLITIEDLVEQIVGEIRDEVEPHARDIIRVRVHLHPFRARRVGAGCRRSARPLEGNDYSTVAGW